MTAGAEDVPDVGPVTEPTSDPPPQGGLYEVLGEFQASMVAGLRDVLQEQSELVTGQLAELRGWVETRLQPLDPVAMAQRVGDMIGPDLRGQVQPLVLAVNSLGERVAMVERTGQSAPSLPAREANGNSGDGGTEGQTKTEKLAAVGAFLETALGMVTDKLLPAIVAFQQNSQMAKRSSAYDWQWAAHLRATDPIQASMIASQLQPEPLALQYQLLLAQNSQQVGTGAYLRGLQTRVDANKILGSGGDPWPSATLSPGLPSSSVNPPPAPAPSSAALPAGASMANNGHRPLRLRDVLRA